MEDKERKYRRIGWISSIATQVVLLILFYFLIAWKEPFPPIPSYGIELSFGVEETGRGQEQLTSPQPETEETEPVSEEPVEEESAGSDPEPEEELNTESEIPSDPVEAEETPVTEEPSPDLTKEKPKEQPKEVVKQEKTEPEEERVTEKPAEAKKEEKKAAINPQATMPPASDVAETNTTKGTTEEKGSEGKEEGTIDGRALMGEQGSADGASLQMSGWIWDFRPQPNDDSAESGKIVYRIKVDSDGYLIGIELLSSTVSPVVERYYRQSVERLSFSKTSDYKSAPVSVGTITFIIRAK